MAQIFPKSACPSARASGASGAAYHIASLVTVKPNRNVLFDLTGIKYLNRDKRELPVCANRYHVWGMMTAVFLWPMYFTYANNLNFGIGPCLIMFIHCMLFMIVFNTIMSELITAIPSSGGANGYARYAFGLLPSFICGVFEFLDVSINSAFVNIKFCEYLCVAFNLFDSSDGLDAFSIFYIAIGLYVALFLMFVFVKGRHLWDVTLVITLLAIAWLFIGLIGAMIYGNFQQNSTNWNNIVVYDDDVNQRRLMNILTSSPTGTPTSLPTSYPKEIWFGRHNEVGFYKSLVANYWNFLGLELASFIAAETIDCNANIPTPLAWSTGAEYVLTIVSTFANVSLLGLSALGTAFPLADGISSFLPIPMQVVYGLSALGPLGFSIAWYFAFTRILFHLSRKGLMPEVLSRLHDGVPVVAAAVSSVIGIALVAIIKLPTDPRVFGTVLSVVNVSGNITVGFIFACFIKLRLSFPSLPRPYVSVFGVTGGVFCLLTSILLFLFNLLAFPSEIATIFVVIIACVSLWSVYFFLVTRKQIIFDSDEKTAIVSRLTVDMLLNTEHGHDYLLQQCHKEHNPESLFCLVEVRTALNSAEGSMSVSEFKDFCERYILEGSEFQVNIGAKLRECFVTILKTEDSENAQPQGSSSKLGHKISSDNRLKVALLRTLAKELFDLINSDILPRWTSKQNNDTIDRFLNNLPVQTSSVVC